jgi:hypothetical protein
MGRPTPVPVLAGLWYHRCYRLLTVLAVACAQVHTPPETTGADARSSSLEPARSPLGGRSRRTDPGSGPGRCLRVASTPASSSPVTAAETSRESSWTTTGVFESYWTALSLGYRRLQTHADSGIRTRLAAHWHAELGTLRHHRSSTWQLSSRIGELTPMIGESSLFVRVCRQRANLASGLEIAIRYEARDGDLGNWPSWGATRAEIVLPANAPEPSDLVYQVARALQPLLHSAGVPGLDDLLVRVQHPDLSGLNWEWLASTLSRKVVRYSRRIAAHAYEPVDLPLSVLFVNAGGNYESSYDDRLAISFRYFRTVQASRQSGADVQRLIAGSQFDIGHLGVRLPAIDPSGRSDEVQHTDGSIFEPRTLEGALRRARTRLLVLEGQDAPPATLVFPLEALRRLAHRIHEATGVAVIASGPANFGQFYYGLTHDQYLTELVKSVRPGINDLDQGPALWLRQGGDAVLRLMGASARIAAEVLQEHQRVEAAYEAQFASGAPKGMTYDQAASRATVEALERLTRLRGETYSFDQESHGVEPISRSRAELLDIQRLRSAGFVVAGGRLEVPAHCEHRKT